MVSCVRNSQSIQGHQQATAPAIYTDQPPVSNVLSSSVLTCGTTVLLSATLKRREVHTEAPLQGIFHFISSVQARRVEFAMLANTGPLWVNQFYPT